MHWILGILKNFVTSLSRSWIHFFLLNEKSEIQPKHYIIHVKKIKKKAIKNENKITMEFLSFKPSISNQLAKKKNHQEAKEPSYPTECPLVKPNQQNLCQISEESTMIVPI